MVRFSTASSSHTQYEAEDILRKAASDASDAVTDFRARHADDALKPAGPPSVSRQEFRDFLYAERNRSRNCGSLPLTVLLWITFLFVTWNHANIHSVHMLRRCLHRTITDIRVAQPLPGGAFGPPARLDNITSTEEVSTWISQGLLPVLAGSAARRGYVCTFNQLVGKVQLRQAREAVGGCRVDGPLADYYRGECRSGSDSYDYFGHDSSGGAMDPAFVVGSGMVGVSQLNKQRFFGWLDPRQLREAQSRATQLFSEGWCDERTSLLEVKVPFFNAEVQSFALATVTFTFERGGLVKNFVEVSPLSLRIYPTAWYVLVDIGWVLLIVAYFFLALQEAFDRKGYGCIGRFFGSVWMVLDWLSIIGGIMIVGFFVFFLQHLGNLEKKVGGLSSRAAFNATDTMSSNSTAALLYDGDLTNVIEDLDWLIWFKSNHRHGMFWYVMLLLCRFFRGFTGQPRIYLIGLTLEKAFSDIAHFGVILLVTCENFALGGCVLFGMELSEWASLSQAHRSTLMVLFGKADFAAMYDFAPVRATIWLVLFIISVAFLISNMVVAILAHHYHEAKVMTSLASPSIFEQAISSFTDWTWRVAYHYRTVHRFVYGRLNISLQKYMPRVRDEPRRVAAVPYDELIQAVTEGMEEAVEKEMETTDAVPIDPVQPFPWNPVNKELLLGCGCDPSTADHLLWKCAYTIGDNLPDIFPADRLFFEFQNAMHGSYRQLDRIGEELHAFLADRVVDLGNIEPRQRKLEDLSVNIQPSQLALEGIPEMPALHDGQGYGRALEEADLLQVGDRLMELGAAEHNTSEPTPHALVPVTLKPP